MDNAVVFTHEHKRISKYSMHDVRGESEETKRVKTTTETLLFAFPRDPLDHSSITKSQRVVKRSGLWMPNLTEHLMTHSF